MANFISYHANLAAQRQFTLIRSALALADYRMKRSQGSGRAYLVWRNAQRQKQAFTLAYNGWGNGKWWELKGSVPTQAIGIVEVCVGGQG